MQLSPGNLDVFVSIRARAVTTPGPPWQTPDACAHAWLVEQVQSCMVLRNSVFPSPLLHVPLASAPPILWRPPVLMFSLDLQRMRVDIQPSQTAGHF